MSPAAALVRRHDRDRYQTALFAPAARREALLALYAFNYEIARVRESVTEPILGQMRFEWWRENIAAAYGSGPVRRHPVVEALTEIIREYCLTREHLGRLIAGREADFTDAPPASLAMLEDYAEDTSSRVIYLALEILDARDAAAAAAARHVGIAFALSGLLRAMPLWATVRRPFIAADLAARAGLDLGNLGQMRNSPGLPVAVAEIAAAAERRLAEARGPARSAPRAAFPALLPAVVAQHSLRRLKRAGYNPFDPAVQQPDPLQIWRLALAVMRRRL